MESKIIDKKELVLYFVLPLVATVLAMYIYYKYIIKTKK